MAELYQHARICKYHGGGSTKNLHSNLITMAIVSPYVFMDTISRLEISRILTQCGSHQKQHGSNPECDRLLVI
ncbi:hypothetical protein E2C01_007017 [Portunus trituberculatus]|uniref:Uncharacterized protein n=1 Tax=Portunus trituberculatus TaxID=210409 RepID=A0A5B7CYW8_PORTR|nr:hypothetical protein [Portunus trituberculatus]